MATGSLVSETTSDPGACASRDATRRLLALLIALVVSLSCAPNEPIAKPGVTETGAGTVFSLEMEPSLAKFYERETDRKNPLLRVWVDASLQIGGGQRIAVRIHARGQNSMRSPRKSFAVDLRSKMPVLPSIEMRKFFLLNLLFDEHGFEMRSAFRLLAKLGVFPAHNRFVRVAINGKDQGLYLLVERPRDAIRRSEPAAVTVLRTWKEGYSEVWTKKGSDPWAIVNQLTSARHESDATKRARRIEALVDFDALAKWMAFNSLVQNADSVDEVFVYEVRSQSQKTGRIGFMGWDYDDLQTLPAHPDNVHADPLTWAAETKLEKTILKTPQLRARYRDVLRRSLGNVLTEEVIKRELAAVRTTLEVVAPTSGNGRQNALRAFETKLLARRRELLALASDEAK